MAHTHICGLYYLVKPVSPYARPDRKYLPQVSLAVHAHIVASTSRTTLTQTFVNPQKDEAIPELRYTFPLYDGVSVVGFTCTINRDRVIKGVVKERAEAKKTFDAAVAKGETAGLFEQLPEASDVFTTTIGNIPAGAEIKVDITYLGELKHDAEADGIRFTIPTHIAPRYGSYPGQMLEATGATNKGGISIVVDAEMANNSQIKQIQSPSHPIAVTIGNTSVGAASGADMSLQKASATLALGTAELGSDFVLHVVATNAEDPIAVLEKHPTIPNHRALMATLVPKFNLPSSRPEVVFLCDRSGSMYGGNKMPNMKTALHLFLKSLPVGLKFNICSFGSRHELLFKDGSKSYDESTLKQASAYVDTFSSDFGGTEMYQPLEDIFKRRFTDMNLEVFLLTDGEIWDQGSLFTMINKYVAESKGAIRVFTLGIGSDVSHALIEGVARAGNGFSQAVGDNEKMNSKVVRMLKASLTPHITDYTLEVKYGNSTPEDDDDGFEVIEKVMDCLAIDVAPKTKPAPKSTAKKIISLFDKSADPDVEMMDDSLDKSASGKYSHVPAVPEPKLLQAPFEIPPLFPFNRASVYLLMSPESSGKTPKSVVLRGTSAYGPLELEIPITTLPQGGETIHQLAARKAVKELEEGRGWIYHASDGNGRLLKDGYPGLFSDMVEREAVRLGVKYQVGGKHCSFVAVENDKERDEEQAVPPPPAYEYGTYDDVSSDEDCGFGLFDDGGDVPSSTPWPASELPKTETAMSADEEEDECMGFGLFEGSAEDSITSESGNSRMRNASMSAGLTSAKSRRSVSPAASAFAAPVALAKKARALVSIPGRSQRDDRAVPKPTTTPGSMGGSDRLASYSGSSRMMAGPNVPALSSIQSLQQVPQQMQQQSFGGGGPPPPPRSGVLAPPPPPSCAPAPSLSEGFARLPSAPPARLSSPSFQQCAMPSSLSKRSDSSDPLQDYQMQLMLQEQQNKERLMMARQEQAIEEVGDRLEAVVALQTFAGFWVWTPRLLKLLELDPNAVDNKIRDLALGVSPGSDLLATALALAYFKEKLAGREDEWEMVADKARDWLAQEAQAKGMAFSATEIVDKVRAVF
ncbi:hypothetical protein OQA88_12703 [Cercophora sp. LCS_1]